MTDEAQVLVSIDDGVGRLTLNRPRALNALSHEMIQHLSATLTAWLTDSEVSVVVLDGAGDRGLCAGGDVRALYENAVAARELRAARKHGGPDVETRDPNENSRRFFFDEYHLNALIARYRKPVVAIMDGITMGGGIGVAGHASIRVVTERSRLAMPETRIGFCPDVGGTWLLSRAPGELGTYLGLNAATINGADAIAIGLADYYVDSDRLPHLIRALAERADPGSAAEVVLLFDETPPLSTLVTERSWIDSCYAADDVQDIIGNLRTHALLHPDTPDAESAHAAADELEQLSPTGLTVTLASFRAARALPTLRDVLAQEYRVSSWFIEQPDLAEGIRAQVVDKDRQPRWSPADLAHVPDAVAHAALTYPAELWP